MGCCSAAWQFTSRLEESQYHSTRGSFGSSQGSDPAFLAYYRLTGQNPLSGAGLAESTGLYRLRPGFATHRDDAVKYSCHAFWREAAVR
jgi:hypothetical protein